MTGGQTRTTALNVRFPKKNKNKNNCAAGRTERPRGCGDAVDTSLGVCSDMVVPGTKGRVPRAVPLWWHLGGGSVVLTQPGRAGGCGAAWGHGVPQRVPVAAPGCPAPVTVLGTRGQRVAGARARGEAEPGALGAGVAPSWEGAAGTWLSRGPLSSPVLSSPAHNPS